MSRGKPIEVSGRRFNSHSAAAKAYGMSGATVSDRLRKNWSIEEALGLKKRSRKHSKKRDYTKLGREKIRNANYQLWLERSLSIHQNQFEYKLSETNFNKQKGNPVPIKCLLHNVEFLVTPFNHLRYPSGGCPQCEADARSKRIFQQKQKEFQIWFEGNVAHRLEFASEFRGMTVDMSFKCKIHKTVKEAKPTELSVNGYLGCDECALEKRTEAAKLNPIELKEELQPLLPSHVGILDIVFKKSTRVFILCDFHGKKEVSVNYLRKSKHKCPECGRHNIGYTSYRFENLIKANDKGSKAYIGLMEIEAFGMRALKVGVTTRTLEERYGSSLKKVFYCSMLDEVDAYILENRIKKLFSNCIDTRIMKAGMRFGNRWSGDTEVYQKSKQEKILSCIKVFITSLAIQTLDYQKELEDFKILIPHIR